MGAVLESLGPNNPGELLDSKVVCVLPREGKGCFGGWIQGDGKEGISTIQDRKDGSRGRGGGEECVWLSNHREGRNSGLGVFLRVLELAVSSVELLDTWDGSVVRGLNGS